MSNVKRYRLFEFIESFVEPNTLIRLWYKHGGGHKSVTEDNKPMMEHELVNSKYKDAIVVGVTDILVTHSGYPEAVNLTIEPIPDTPATEQTTKEGFVSIDEVTLENKLCRMYDLWVVEKRQSFRSVVKETICEIKASKQSLSNTPVFDAEKINQRIDQLAEMEEVFNAARLTHPIAGMKYDTFMDYCRAKDDVVNFPAPKSNTPKEEQTSKDYVVLSLMGDYGGHKNVRYVYNTATGFYVPELHQFNYGLPNWTLDDVIKNHNGEIHSIRRISDNEIFSVGDEVVCILNDEIFKIRTIKISGEPYLLDGDTFHKHLLPLRNAKKLPSTKPEEQPKERIEVRGFTYKTIIRNGFSVYEFETTKSIPAGQFPLIKQAIERILNNEKEPQSKIWEHPTY